ncbi:aminopeptidase [Mucilaginibacter sp. 21P]|uniref:M1 family metallopeptidase n=1 Tax=Mucilaginibacter sp. 21P TaxID=2778902 RepID=UPI001C5A1F36|nr:M1 family aminopeptidase [Mucilaginibacter sp. 21P]QXV65622.1 aminopeptidase [Mucilaginibacter sp. 21P]
MRRLLTFLILIALPCIIYAQQLPVEAGVPLRLAQYRKAVIDSITYQITFRIPEKKTDPIKALVLINFDLKTADERLQLDFKQSADHVKEISVNFTHDLHKPDTLEPINLRNEHLIISTKRLKKGRNQIEIIFTPGDASLNRNDDYLYALFVPDHARTVFPCFDQPDLKARYTLGLNVPPGWKVLANSNIKDSSAYQDHVEYRFKQSDKLPTYLFSFTAGKYTSVKKMLDGREAEFLYRETDEQKIKLSVDSVFEQHRQAIRFLEDWTTIKYPFQKVGFVAIPDFQFGGMEHPGEIQYKASGLFLDDAATKDAHIARANVISHETAHMWFGDLVTMRWFNDVWTKEVFANFMADKVTEKLMGTATFNLKFLQDHYPAAYAVDRTAGANPIRQQLDNLQDAGSMYGNIIYHKAPIMMRQLELLMGKSNFQAGVREYLKTYAYSNATWPNLIEILGKHTKADLSNWNKVWVYDTGRPVIEADVSYSNGKISKLTLAQHPESGPNRIWPQAFDITLVYPNGQQTIPVNLNAQKIQVSLANGKPKPIYIIYNSNGMGYGVFPVEKALDPAQFALQSPVQRASVYINLYENMLNGRGYSPAQLMALFGHGLQTEKEETNLRMLTGYISNIYWEFINTTERTNIVVGLEKALWSAVQSQSLSNNKKILFGTYQNIYTSEAAAKEIYNIWKTQTPPKGVKLTEDDYTGLAFTIALKSDTVTNVLKQQEERITNTDRKKRIEFLMPALSLNVKERDSFFHSLKDRKNRAKEAWVLSALGYLHHPLRQKTSIKYIPESLNMLAEIQATGDIFFPQGFINATFGNYQSKEAAIMVRDFIKTHPDLNPKLMGKLSQGVDNLVRTQRLMRN